MLLCLILNDTLEDFVLSHSYKYKVYKIDDPGCQKGAHSCHEKARVLLNYKPQLLPWHVELLMSKDQQVRK